VLDVGESIEHVNAWQDSTRGGSRSRPVPTTSSDTQRSRAPLHRSRATGEVCQNRVLFKQFLQARRSDSCRSTAAGWEESTKFLAVLLMAAKFGVPVCRMQAVSASANTCNTFRSSTTSRERVFGESDVRVRRSPPRTLRRSVCRSRRALPRSLRAGYSISIRPESLDAYEFPADVSGARWRRGLR